MDATVDHPTGAKNGTSQQKESSEANPRPKLGRLSVNVTPATQAALDRLAEREGVTVTEALRRLVGYGDLVYETTQVKGHDLLIRRDGALERIVLI
jgi:Ribbon-helix-helix protein, copG family